MDGKQVEALQNEVAAVAAEIGKRHGVPFVVRNRASYGEGHVTLTIELAESDTASRAGEALRRNAGWLGLPADIVGKEFKFQGVAYIVTGLNRSAKRPINVKRAKDGKEFRFNDKAVRAAIGLPVSV